jgi:raffinose/stachyose/melibiose transport system substrate-binding protein
MAYIVYKCLAIVLAALVTLLSVGSCAATGDSLPAATAVEDIPVEAKTETIHILQSQGEIGQSLQQAVDQYAAANPGVRFSVQTVAGDSNYSVALRARMLSGDRVDIFQVLHRGDVLELAPHLADLSGLDWVREAVPGTLDAVTVGNRIYGIPYSVEGLGLIVNGDIFEKANIYLGNIPTIAAMEEVFLKLQTMINDGDLGDILPELEAVTEFAAQDRDYLGSAVADVLLTDAYASPLEAYAADYLELPLSDNVKEFVRIMALYSTCTSWAQLNDVTQNRQIEAGIAAGRVAVILQNAEVYRRIVAADPAMGEKLRLLPIPLGTDEAPRSAVYTGVPAYWVVNAAASDSAKDASLRFLTWLYQSDSGTALYAGRFGAISPYRAAAKDTGNPLHSQILRQLENGNTLPMLHTFAPSGWGETILAQNLRGYLAKELTWEDMLQANKEAWHEERAFAQP